MKIRSAHMKITLMCTMYRYEISGILSTVYPFIATEFLNQYYQVEAVSTGSALG